MPPKKTTKVISDDTNIKNSIINIIVLSSKGDIKKGKLNTDNGKLSIEIVQTYFRKKSIPEVVGTYRYEKYLLTLIGYKEGKNGTENKHELPEPYNDTVLYGDAIIIASELNDWQNNPCSFKSDQFETFIASFNEANDESDIDDIIEEEEVDEEVDIENEEEVEEDEIIEEVVEEEVISKKKEVKKKKVVPANSGYEKQQKLLHQNNFKELSIDSSLNLIREKCIKKFQFLN
jgi:hypothetical protein